MSVIFNSPTIRRGGIVKDGLVLNLDAADTFSYPRTGTRWNDLSGNGNHATLVNSPSFSYNNDGYFIFNGTNNYVTLSNLILNTTTGFTIDLIVYIEDPQPVYSNFWSYWYASGNGFEWGTYASGSNQGKFLFKDNSASGSPGISTTYIGNQWAIITFGCNNAIPFMYLNGNYQGVANTFRTNTNITLSRIFGSSTPLTTYYKCYSSGLKAYNRALSASEVSQNFEALRGRFGI